MESQEIQASNQFAFTPEVFDPNVEQLEAIKAEVAEVSADEANQFSKDVIAYEKSLVAIIEPEEKRLKGIEDESKEYAIKEERRATLGEFKAKLATIGDVVDADDDFLLSFDPAGRDQYYTERLQAKLELDKAAKEAQEREEAEKAERAKQDLFCV